MIDVAFHANGRAARNEADGWFGVDVFAPAAALAQGLVDDEARRLGAGRHLEPIDLGYRPPQAVVATKHGLERRRFGAGAQALEGRHEARFGLLLLGGSKDDDEDRNAADGRGQTGAHEPAEAAFAQRLGMVCRVHVACAAGLCAPVKRGRAARLEPNGHGPAPCNRRVTSMIDHELARPFPHDPVPGVKSPSAPA